MYIHREDIYVKSAVSAEDFASQKCGLDSKYFVSGIETQLDPCFVHRSHYFTIRLRLCLGLCGLSCRSPQRQH